MTHITSFKMAASALLALAAILALPALSYAATYAYVNVDGEVRTVISDNPDMAIATAPSIHIHSGVLLLDSQSDTDLVGDNVGGI